ncbi:MAG TPA: carboxypeptidase regulatory-like domain-containing protein [Edaphobacter sp.]|nr:carboxypeptidase regulatory-like domain-containing protein [Edaphobacter sp.]
MNLKRIFLTAVALSLVVASILPATAQTSKGILAGIVRDRTGAVIPGAKVTLTSQDTSEARGAVADERGAYRIDAVNSGHYMVSVQAGGFETANTRDINVVPSIVTTYDPVLTVGEVSQAVTVEANTNNINTENGQLSSTVGTAELAKVPIFTLNPIELLQTVPGVQIVDQNLGINGIGGNFEQIEVNGARPRSNNFMMDGQDINDVGIGGQAFNIQIPDAYQSVTALTNSSSAEYGRSGGAVVNLITKAGTNQFHGDVWELYTGSGLDSLDGITRQGKPYTSNPKARYDQHQIGFTLGGPIWRDKLYGFGAAQFSRFYGRTQPGSVELPDAAGYAQLTAIGGPQVALLKSLLSGGQYLTSYTNVGAANAYKISPRAGCTAGCSISTALFERPPIAQQQPQTQWLYRVDFLPSAKDTFSFRYLHDRSNFNPYLPLNTSGLPGFDSEVGGPAEVAQGTWTHVFTPRMLNELRASETRVNFLFQPTPETRANPLSKNYNITFLGQGFAGSNNALGISQNMPQGNNEELYQFQDTVSWTHGRHTLRFGADVGRQIETDVVAQNALGGLLFAKGGALSPLDNFLDNFLGASGSASKTFGPTRIDPHTWKSAVFVQDDIKLSSDLTINAGFRYDYLTAPENSLPYPALDLNNPFAPVNTVVKAKNDTNNVAPRFGFAWNPHGNLFSDGKTVFHGGIGAFYDTDFTNIATNGAQSSPNAPTGLLTSTTGRGLANATSLLGTISPVLSPQSSVLSISSNLVNPLTWQWNVGVERQLPAQVKLTVNYVGNHGEKLYANQQLNYFVNGSRINPTRNAINVRANRADSEYNSLQTEVSRQFSRGLFFRVAYTYGKDLDDASDVFATFASPTSYSANLSPNGLHQDWGPSVWDHRHYVSFSYAWTPVGLRSSNGAADMLFSAFTRHITISGTTQLQSGYHSTFNVSGVDLNGDGSTANDRPLVGNPGRPIDTAGFDGYYYHDSAHTPGVYYDAVTNAPTTADKVHWLVPHGPQFTTQEVGRNSFVNPNAQYWNIAVEKDVPSTWLRFERGMFVFRVEAQNFTNHNNIAPLDINLNDIGTTSYLNKQNAIEPTFRHLLLWAKYRF